MELILADPQPYFYRFVYNLIFQNCVREGKNLFNLFLISKALPRDYEVLIEENEPFFIVKDYYHL